MKAAERQIIERMKDVGETGAEGGIGSSRINGSEDTGWNGKGQDTNQRHSSPLSPALPFSLITDMVLPTWLLPTTTTPFSFTHTFI